MPPEVLRKIYFDNARKLLVRRLPFAKRIGADRDGWLTMDWLSAAPARVESQINRGQASTTARVLMVGSISLYWLPQPVHELLFEALKSGERRGLWNKDVVEAFVGTGNPNHYTEYEVAPTGEKLDLNITPTDKSLEWSGFEAATHIDRERKIWTAEMRIPLKSLSEQRSGGSTFTGTTAFLGSCATRQRPHPGQVRPPHLRVIIDLTRKQRTPKARLH